MGANIRPRTGEVIPAEIDKWREMWFSYFPPLASEIQPKSNHLPSSFQPNRIYDFVVSF